MPSKHMAGSSNLSVDAIFYFYVILFKMIAKNYNKKEYIKIKKGNHGIN